MKHTHGLVSFARTLLTPSPKTHSPTLAPTSTLSSLRFLCTSSSPSSNKLFVAGLSWSVDEKSLKDAFATYGQISEVRIVYDKETGRSRGFGFVYFSKEEEARCAKDAMDGKAFLGRPLRINYALERVRGAPLVVPRLKNAACQND